jgi:hypothetical protein
MLRPKKPPKPKATEAALALEAPIVNYEPWCCFHSNVKVRKHRKPVRYYCCATSHEDDTVTSSDDESFAPVSPPKTKFYVDGSLPFAFNPNQPPSCSPESLCYIACSTDSTELDEPSKNWFKANFGEAEELHLVGPDKMCSRHLFSDTNDFIGDIVPIDPLDICVVAGGFTAKGVGMVQVQFWNDNGKLVDKKIYKALYAPESMVRLISITQLARQAPDTATTRMTTSKNSTE